MKPKRTTDAKLLAAVRKLPCIHCGGNAEHVHHVKTRGAGGGDVAWNLMPLCAEAHRKIHLLGTDALASLYAGVNDWLLENGWEFDDHRTRWLHP